MELATNELSEFFPAFFVEETAAKTTPNAASASNESIRNEQQVDKNQAQADDDRTATIESNHNEQQQLDKSPLEAIYAELDDLTRRGVELMDKLTQEERNAFFAKAAAGGKQLMVDALNLLAEHSDAS